MNAASIRITKATITPVAFADPPLLNSVGVHEPFALREIIEVVTDAGLAGLGETYADEKHLAALHTAADAIKGVKTDTSKMLVVFFGSKWNTFFVGQALPGLIMVFRRVGKYSIQVENDSFWLFQHSKPFLSLI